MRAKATQIWASTGYYTSMWAGRPCVSTKASILEPSVLFFFFFFCLDPWKNKHFLILSQHTDPPSQQGDILRFILNASIHKSCLSVQLCRAAIPPTPRIWVWWFSGTQNIFQLIIDCYLLFKANTNETTENVTVRNLQWAKAEGLLCNISLRKNNSLT